MKLIGVADIDVEAPGIKRAKELNVYTTYYYKVTAVDTSGNEGSSSTQVYATTPQLNVQISRTQVDIAKNRFQ